MANAKPKTVVLNSQNNSLPLLLLALAALLVCMAALWLVLPPSARDADSMSHGLMYASGSALLGLLGLLRDSLPPALRLGVVKLARVAVLGLVVLLLGAALGVDLLSLPYIMGTLLLLLVAALVKPD